MHFCLILGFYRKETKKKVETKKNPLCNNGKCKTSIGEIVSLTKLIFLTTQICPSFACRKQRKACIFSLKVQDSKIEIRSKSKRINDFVLYIVCALKNSV